MDALHYSQEDVVTAYGHLGGGIEVYSDSEPALTIGTLVYFPGVSLKSLQQGKVMANTGRPPVWLAVERLREQSARPHLQQMIAVQAADVETVLDALVEAERIVPWDREGGEA